MHTTDPYTLVPDNAAAQSRLRLAIGGLAFLTLVGCGSQNSTGSSAIRHEDVASPQKSEANAQVERLLGASVPRDVEWARELEEWLPRAKFAVSNPEPSPQPPELPYIEATLGQSGTSAESFPELVDRLTTAGAGLTLLIGGKPAVQIAFGALATYRMFHAWKCPDGWNGDPSPMGREALTRHESLKVGAPNFHYLPDFVRTPLRRHLQAAGVSEPRTLLVMWPERGNHRDLAFSVLPSQFSRERFQVLMHSLNWFLPQGYQYIAWDAVASSSESSVLL